MTLGQHDFGVSLGADTNPIQALGRGLGAIGFHREGHFPRAFARAQVVVQRVEAEVADHGDDGDDGDVLEDVVWLLLHRGGSFWQERRQVKRSGFREEQEGDGLGTSRLSQVRHLQLHRAIALELVDLRREGEVERRGHGVALRHVPPDGFADVVAVGDVEFQVLLLFLQMWLGFLKQLD